MILELEGKKFDLDIEKTKKYYTTHSLCNCVGCRNFYMQSKQKFPLLNIFLEKFGVDISKPDEIVWGDVIDDELDYMVVYYTVNGKILETDQYEIDISDTTFLSIIVENGYIPNNQETDDYFIVSVYGIVLPYILEEPFTQKVKSKRRNNKGNRASPNRFFERIIHIKKTQTKD